jgi:hypothetical protein
VTTFYLGTHQPAWLTRLDVPLFISDRRLKDRKTLPVARGPWALDSGGFTELQQYGAWTTTPAEYVTRVRRYRDEIGHLAWAAPQDWMCEQVVIDGGVVNSIRFAGTHLTVREHQWRTIDNLWDLRGLAPDLPFIPVVQGQTPADYLRHVDWYRATGIDLRDEPLVGVGSVCRRQNMDEAGDILKALHRAGLTRLHGFGFKMLGLERFSAWLASADSLAWSFEARRAPVMRECRGGTHRSCANCPTFAMAWRRRALEAIDHLSVEQDSLLDLLAPA